MSSTNLPPTPTTVEPGQIWRDNDQRTRGSGEFTVVAVAEPRERVRYGDVPDGMLSRAESALSTARRYVGWFNEGYAVVHRHKTDRLSSIQAARLLNGTNTQRGYTYLGRQK